LIRVDFPAPFGPTMPIITPSGTSRSISQFYIRTVMQELTAINEASVEVNYSIFPQASKNTLQIRGLVEEGTKFTVYNLAGQFIGEYSLGRGELNTIELPTLKNGIYVGVVQSQKQTKSIKFMWNR